MASRVRVLTSTVISAHGPQRQRGGDRLIDESSHQGRRYFFRFVGTSIGRVRMLHCASFCDFHHLCCFAASRSAK